jgi:hypothetical protein
MDFRTHFRDAMRCTTSQQPTQVLHPLLRPRRPSQSIILVTRDLVRTFFTWQQQSSRIYRRESTQIHTSSAFLIGAEI